MCTIIVQQPPGIPLLRVHNLNSMVARVPTHVPASWGPSVYCRRSSLHVSCMQLIPQNPSALGLRRLQGIFTCARLECTIHTTCSFSLIRPYIYMDFNTHIPGGHLRGPLTRPDYWADLLHIGTNVWSPLHRAQRSGPVHKPPSLKLSLLQRRDYWVLWWLTRQFLKG